MRKPNYYTIEDLKNIILREVDYVEGEIYEHKMGSLWKFIGIKNEMVAYNPHTFDRMYLKGVFYEFESVVHKVVTYSVGYPKTGEWKKVSLYKG